MKTEYLEKLKSGKKSWNAFRAKVASDKNIDFSREALNGLNLSGYNLSHCNFVGANLIDTNLSYANFSHSDCRNCRFIAANLKQANFDWAKLDGAEFLTATVAGISLVGNDLRSLDLELFDLRHANLNETNLSGKNMTNFDCNSASLIGANLSGALLDKGNFSGVDFTGANLKRTSLVKANLQNSGFTAIVARGADFSSANLTKSNLSGADLRSCNFNETLLDGSELSGCKFSAAKVKHWSIKKAKCKDCSWDENGKEFISFKKGEFERLYGARKTITLKYPDGIRAQEISTLPFLIEHLIASQWGCSILLQSMQHFPGVTEVILSIDDMGDFEPTELANNLQQEAEQLQLAQFELRDNLTLQHDLKMTFSSVKEKFWPRMLELAAEHQAAQNRHLTVLFMDLKDFSQWPEAEMANRLELFRGLLKPILNRWQASYPNMEGDSLRVTFHNAAVGVKCALMIQNVLIAAGFNLRIGMDLGPVFVSQNAVTGIADLGGTALNFAARLEKTAEPGHVLVSERVKHFSRSLLDQYEFIKRDVLLQKAVGTFKAGTQVTCFQVEEK